MLVLIGLPRKGLRERPPHPFGPSLGGAYAVLRPTDLPFPHRLKILDLGTGGELALERRINGQAECLVRFEVHQLHLQLSERDDLSLSLSDERDLDLVFYRVHDAPLEPSNTPTASIRAFASPVLAGFRGLDAEDATRFFVDEHVAPLFELSNLGLCPRHR